ncbi:MAG TPA: hypothetical protein VM529_07870 [Gemmata sp.]|nr:hypothetical protein [Gemmata sp.]
MPQSVETVQQVADSHFRYTVADEECDAADQVGLKLEVQRAVPEQALEVAGLRQDDRRVVLEVAVELDDLRHPARGMAHPADVGNLHVRHARGLVCQFEVPVVVGGVDDRETQLDNEAVDLGAACLRLRVAVPLDVHPTPEGTDRAGAEDVVLGECLGVAETEELVAVNAQFVSHVRRQLRPGGDAEIHGHARPDERQGAPVADRVDELLHGWPRRRLHPRAGT